MNKFMNKFKKKFKIALRSKNKIKFKNALRSKNKITKNKFKYKLRLRLKSRFKYKLRLRLKSRFNRENKLKHNFRAKFRHKFKKLFWTDYRLKNFNLGRLPFRLKENKKTLFLNLNYQKFRNFYKKNFYFSSVIASSDFYLKFYRFFFFKSKVLSKKKKKFFFINFKLRKRRKKLISSTAKKKKKFFIKKSLKVFYFKKYNFLYKNNFFLYKNNFQNFNRKFLKLLSTKFLTTRKNNFFFINKKKSSLWSFLFEKKFNEINKNLKKKIKYSQILRKRLRKSSKKVLISKKRLERLYWFKHFSKRKKLKIFLFKKILRMKVYKKKISNKKKKNIYLKNFFFLSNSGSFFTHSGIYFFKTFFTSYFFKSKRLKKNLFFKNFLFLEKKTINFYIFNLKSKIKNLFILNFNGFVYLDRLNSLNFFRKENAWILRKIIYSFATKNEVQNFILKKYIKNHYKSIPFEKNNFLNFSSTNLNPYDFKTKFVEWAFDLTPKFFEQEVHSFNSYYFSTLKNYQTLVPFSFYSSLYTFSLPTIDWAGLILEPYYVHSLTSRDYNFTIKKTKFKPGYSSMWREYRSTLKISLNLKFRYQQQLTKYLLRFNKIIQNRLYYLFEMQLDNVLTLSKFFPDRSWSIFFINEGLIFVNGYRICNIYEQLFKNDFVQLIVSLKYYIVYRWLLNWQIFKKIKLRKRLNNRINMKNLPDDKQKSRNLPVWILKNKNFNEDVARYLEVDYFSLSFFIVYEPLFITDINPLSFIGTRFNVLNLFNWKYIN